MSPDYKNRIRARLFVGILVTSEVRMHLNASSFWKNASIEAAHGSEDLLEIKRRGKDYVGSYIPGDRVQFVDLAAYEKQIIDKLLSYCPQLPKNSCHFHVIPQLLIY